MERGGGGVSTPAMIAAVGGQGGERCGGPVSTPAMTAAVACTAEAPLWN